MMPQCRADCTPESEECSSDLVNHGAGQGVRDGCASTATLQPFPGSYFCADPKRRISPPPANNPMKSSPAIAASSRPRSRATWSASTPRPRLRAMAGGEDGREGLRPEGAGLAASSPRGGPPVAAGEDPAGCVPRPGSVLRRGRARKQAAATAVAAPQDRTRPERSCRASPTRAPGAGALPSEPRIPIVSWSFPASAGPRTRGAPFGDDVLRSPHCGRRVHREDLAADEPVRRACAVSTRRPRLHLFRPSLGARCSSERSGQLPAVGLGGG